jgi:hypothetical protein
MGVGKEDVASCGWGGTLRLRAKAVHARDRGAKTAEKLVGHRIRVRLALWHGTVPPFCTPESNRWSPPSRPLFPSHL